MKLVKRCLSCHKEIKKPYKYSISQWKSVKCCSRICMANIQKEKFKGKHFSKNTEFKSGQTSKDKNINWKGGKQTTKFGYLYEMAKKHPNNVKGYVMKHRLVVENYLGRLLSKAEVVHHIDGNTSNNNLDNLELFNSQAEHAMFHKLNA